MNKKLLFFYSGIIALLLFFSFSCSTTHAPSKQISNTTFLKQTYKTTLPRSMKALFVTTLFNIDWPPKNSTAIEQKNKAIQIIAAAQKAHFNTIILQVRPMGDAFYHSHLEPWSSFLTGTQGLQPTYDPLHFWISQAHKHNLQIEAWINPFRIGINSVTNYAPNSPLHTLQKYAFKSIGGDYYLDPTAPKVQNYTLKVIYDLVYHYSLLDGVLLDDNFFPYQVQNDMKINHVSFYAASDRAKRLSLNRFLNRFYNVIRATNKHMLVGIAPFGIWKSGHPPSVKGLSSYNQLYTDSVTWLKKQDADYIAPQLYWPSFNSQQNFATLVNWWLRQKRINKHLWVTLNITNNPKATMDLWFKLKSLKSLLGSDQGFLVYHANAFLKNKKIMHLLTSSSLNEQALLPLSPWLKTKKPRTPLIKLNKELKGFQLQLPAHYPQSPFAQYIIVGIYQNMTKHYQIIPVSTKNNLSFTVPYMINGKQLEFISLYESNSNGVLSAPSIFYPHQNKQIQKSTHNKKTSSKKISSKNSSKKKNKKQLQKKTK